jgi:hypothetical protein
MRTLVLTQGQFVLMNIPYFQIWSRIASMHSTCANLKLDVQAQPGFADFGAFNNGPGLQQVDLMSNPTYGGAPQPTNPFLNAGGAAPLAIGWHGPAGQSTAPAPILPAAP